MSAGRSAHKRQYREYLSDIDRRFQHLAKEVLPHHPYYNDLPIDKPFDARGRYSNDWAIGPKGPFSASEAHLQYMTFTTNTDADTLLKSVGGWADDNGNIMEDDISRSNSGQSGNSTPINTAQRKKISLSDYKRKAMDSPAPAVKSSGAGNGVQDKVPKDTPRLEKKRADQTDITSSSNSKANSHAHRDTTQNTLTNGISSKTKHLEEDKRAASDDQTKSIPSSTSRKNPVRPPEKDRPSKERAAQSSTQSDIPSLISPTLPPMSNGASDLPRLLSPTLPPDIEEYLLQQRQEQTSRDDDRKRDDATISADRKELKSGSSNSSQNRIANGDPIGLGITGTATKDAAVKGIASERTAFGSKGPVVDGPARRSKIVKLKYGRRNRMRISSLLKLSSKRPKQDSSPAPGQEGGKGVRARDEDRETHRDMLSASRAEKRPREAVEEDGERAMKRPKSASNDRPSTPAASTPVVNSPFTTPRKEAKGHPMRRVQSTDGMVKTPQSTSTPHAPGSIERPTSAAVKHSPLPPTPSHHGRDEDRQAWQVEYQKYQTMGRSLKHAADRQKQDAEKSGTSRKLAAATAVEAIITFMLAFIAMDQCSGKSGVSDNWRSMLAYCRAVKSNAEAYPHLRGLCCLLGAFMREVIHSRDLERLHVISFPAALSNVKGHPAGKLTDNSPALTPGSDGTANASDSLSSDEIRRFLRDLSELKARLPEMDREAHALWLEGSRFLSDDLLAKQFPATWAKRSRNYDDRGKRREEVVPGRYENTGSTSGSYYLPLGGLSTPLETVRFGLALLTEWCDRESVPWKATLKL